jgi:hypothetical protein
MLVAKELLIHAHHGARRTHAPRYGEEPCTLSVRCAYWIKYGWLDWD